MTKTKKIEKFLEENFEHSSHAGDVAANSKVYYCRRNREFTIDTGVSQNNITGSYEEVMEELQTILDMWSTL